MNNNYAQQGVPMGATYPQKRGIGLLTNPLTPEQQNEMRTKNTGLSLKIPKEEINRSICTHKDTVKQGFSVNTNSDGTVTCDICGETFDPAILSEDQVQHACDVVINILECCKLVGVSLPENMVRQFFAMTPYIRRLPQVYKIAVNSYKDFMSKNPAINPQSVNPNFNPFNTFASIVNGGYNGYQNPAYVQQPVYPNQQQPVYPNYQQPVYPNTQPVYQQPMYDMNNYPQQQVQNNAQMPNPFMQQQGVDNTNPYQAMMNNTAQVSNNGVDVPVPPDPLVNSNAPSVMNGNGTIQTTQTMEI